MAVLGPTMEVPACDDLPNDESSVNGGGKVQRGAGEMGDTRDSGYLPAGLLSMDRDATGSAVAASPAGERRRLASLRR